MVGLVGFRFLLVVVRFCRDCWGLLCYVGWVVGIACLLALARCWCLVLYFNSVV